MMKAIQYTSFGDSSVLKLVQIEKPGFGENEVLIKITATTVNPLDIKIRTGSMQKVMPVQLPFIPGGDVSGTVEGVGKNVSRVKIGDKVFANNFGGTYTEYISIHEERVSIKPMGISDNEAVALVVPLITSYTVLIEKAKIRSGQKILIHGAAGGVGSIMVQMAKALGAYVIGTASGKGVADAKQLGADEVVDYKTQDFTQLVKNVDIVADLVGKDTQVKSFDVLKKGGQLISTVMPPSQELAEKFGVTALFVSSNASYKKLDFGKELVEAGKIKAQIAKTMKLEQAAEAQDLIANAGVNGKIVLEIN